MNIATNRAEGKAMLARLRTETSGRVLTVPARASVEESLDSFARHAHFPDYFGHNLDALVDCLRDLENTTIVWTHADRLRTADEAGYQSILGVLGQVDAENSDFQVLVTP